MPYITQEERDKLDPIIDKLPTLNDGELNYVITRICHRFLAKLGLRYMNLVRVLGGLICVMFELYRCVAAPYEDKKKAENGFISNLDRITPEEKQAVWKCECGCTILDNEFDSICGSELTHYVCPSCGKSRDKCTKIRERIK